ncbi:MAG: hypothetical protein JEZ12_24085 [Desulfobacterium sp.]|nr:hypothetical protein [Desulfobacterium sp.]
MMVMQPETIDFATLVSSNISADTTTPEYNAGTTYAIGAVIKVPYAVDGSTPIGPVGIYKSKVVDNVGNYPPYNCDPDDDTAPWEYLGATNRWKWADTYINTQTMADGTEATDPGVIVMILNADKCDSIGIAGCVGTKVTFTLTNPSEGVVDTTVMQLPNAAVEGTAWDYCFEDFVWEHDIVHDFPIFHQATLEIRIEHEAEGEYPGCGFVVLGRVADVGITKLDVGSGATDYSEKDDTKSGDVFLKPGKYAKYMDLEVQINTVEYDRIQQIFTAIRGKATVFVGNNPGTSFKSLIVFGFWYTFGMVLQGSVKSRCNLEIKGLT